MSDPQLYRPNPDYPSEWKRDGMIAMLVREGQLVPVQPDLFHHYCWTHKKPNTTDHKMWRAYVHGKCDVSTAAIIRVDAALKGASDGKSHDELSSDDSIDVGFLPVGITVDEIRDAVGWIERGALAQEAIELATMEDDDE